MRMLLGGHVSISGGIYNAPQRGADITCDVIQIFSKNQKQWQSPPLDPEVCERFRDEMERCSIGPSMVHTSYLINLAAIDRERKVKSRKAFQEEMERAEALGIPLLNFHPGSHLKEGEIKGIAMVGEALKEALDKSSGYTVKLLIETVAGQGASVGYRFEHIRDMIDGAGGDERIGVCYDTCHSFAAGYDIRDTENYEKTFDQFDNIIGLDRLMGFHLNDCKKELGEKVDRHEHIGEGFIGNEGFRLLMNDTRLENIPGILETPGGEENYPKNLKKLRTFT